MLERAERKNCPERVAELAAQLETPPFPEALRYLWGVFWRLRRRIRPGMEGVAPITFADLRAFQKTTLERLTPWEVGVIERLDDLYLDAMGEAAERARNPASQPASKPGAMRMLTQDAPRRRAHRATA